MRCSESVSLLPPYSLSCRASVPSHPLAHRKEGGESYLPLARRRKTQSKNVHAELNYVCGMF